ncbi:serine/threonine protein kinase [Streptomyces sp. 8K308]|uniref:serine/threonine-protein kinase n=1 Tax=Streptomyces sp. 8K308 TaxID=2530388 RepID=UPI0010469B9F|nr:serine/threonine-protein kinase [Streptomyces sp. 8K308]TDC20992.1 serine/threonine protein kinase [Streptomyces sp. 8K308]
MEALRGQDPAVIGEFTLLARLGAGGMGRVYLGRSPGGTRAAVKVIREDIAEEPGALARFRREVATVRAVRSPFTANLISASLDASPYWLATEYVPGPTLLRALRDGPLAPEACRGLLAALAEGLAAVHAQGVVHRDLKPHNVILAPNGPRLIDFGIARTADQTQLTRTGQAPGTPGYTAPEVLLGAEAGPAADVFALGATLAAAATGRAPYGGGEWPAVSYRVVHGEVDVADVDPWLAALIRACVAREPADRPTPADVVRRCAVSRSLTDLPTYRALQALAEQAPHDLPTATAAGLVPPTPTTTGRGRRRQITAAALAVTALTTTVALWLGTRDDGTAPGDDTAGGTQANGGGTTSSGVQGGEGGDGGEEATASGVRGGGEEVDGDETPTRIVETNPVRDYWDGSRCVGEDTQTEARLLFDVARDGNEVSVSFGHNDDFGSLEPPFLVTATVKPPHDIDPGTGRPIEGLFPNMGFGYVSDAWDVATDGHAQLTYPDDFPEAIPLTNDPGAWTVLFYAVEGPQNYVRIACSGFTVE